MIVTRRFDLTPKTHTQRLEYEPESNPAYSICAGGPATSTRKVTRHHRLKKHMNTVVRDVCFGSEADINSVTQLRPLSGAKRTSKGHCRGFAV